jgi:hypothetical protein
MSQVPKRFVQPDEQERQDAAQGEIERPMTPA